MTVKSIDFFGRTPIPLYYRRSPCEVQWFADLMDDFPEIEFTHPDWRDSPWWVQGELPNGIFMDFWPHTTKGKVQYSRHVETTASGVRSLVEQNLELDSVDVFEPFDPGDWRDEIF